MLLYIYKPRNPKSHPMCCRGFRIGVPPLKAGGAWGWGRGLGFLWGLSFVYSLVSERLYLFFYVGIQGVRKELGFCPVL